MQIAERDPVTRPVESRQFVDDLLSELAARRYRPSAWAAFLGRSLARSMAQIRKHPAAAAELTLLHLPAWIACGRVWVSVSWFLSITHLGLLGDSSTFGWPNRLTLLRAQLPALAPDLRWISLVALATDFADGHLARRGEESAFGAFADPIADGVFWSWYAMRWERRRWLRWAPVSVFGVTTAAIAAAYFARGRTIDYPRLVPARYASAIAQLLLTVRTMRSAMP